MTAEYPQSPQEQLDVDTAECIRLERAAQEARNPITRLILTARAKYAGYLVGEDMVEIERAEAEPRTA
jgi:hypothetical protein